LFTTLGAAVAVFVVLVACHFFLLLKPSDEGKCGGFSDGPAPALPQVARLRGQAVGASLGIVQYRWLRRLFKARGTRLSLRRQLPSTEFKGNVVSQSESVRDIVIDESGTFDFGVLAPGRYDLNVSYPGDDAVVLGLVIDPSASNTGVLIDASPAQYCYCCGWSLEPR
jgi:hypothetical protein